MRHALVLHGHGRDPHGRAVLRGSNRVPRERSGRWWYGNCAWDAIGICAALHADGRVKTSCPDCGDPIVLDVHGRKAQADGLLFHCLVPATHWWDDIVFT